MKHLKLVNYELNFEKIPKLLFPFNEDYLKFAIGETLEQVGFSVIFDFAIPIKKSEGYFSPKLKKTNILPDVFLPDYGYFIEVENFYSSNPLKQFREYSSYLELNNYSFKGCVITWKCKEFTESSELHLVDPITGDVNIPIIRSEPVKIEIYGNKDYPVGLAGSIHTWIQYELFKWLKRSGNLVSAEIHISPSGHVFVPDELRISPNEGIIDWYPEKFTPYSGWSYYHVKSYVPKERHKQVDISSYNGEEIHCYEIKLPEHFTSQERVIKSLQQLHTYIKAEIFDRIWLVGPYEWIEKLYNYVPEIFFGELQKIGILGYDFAKRDFSIIKDAKKLDVKRREYTKIRIL